MRGISWAVVGVAMTAAAATGLSATLASATTFPGYNGKIAFSSDRDGANHEIYVMDPDGSNQTRLTSNTLPDTNPAWSPDGTRIAFVSSRDGNAEIYVMSADGSNPTRLTNNSVGDTNPTWSPDGSRIAFLSGQSGVNTIWIMNADGSNAFQLLPNSLNANFPAWSPDGTRIAFSAQGPIKPDTPPSRPWMDMDIFVVEVDDVSNITRLTESIWNDDWPAWSPDSTRIAFKCDPSGVGWEICATGADGSSLTRLTNTQIEVMDYAPVWSPDGNYLIFLSNRDNIGYGGDIYRMDADGSDVVRFTTGIPGSSTGSVPGSWQRSDTPFTPTVPDPNPPDPIASQTANETEPAVAPALPATGGSPGDMAWLALGSVVLGMLAVRAARGLRPRDS